MLFSPDTLPYDPHVSGFQNGLSGFPVLGGWVSRGVWEIPFYKDLKKSRLKRLKMGTWHLYKVLSKVYATIFEIPKKSKKWRFCQLSYFWNLEHQKSPKNKEFKDCRINFGPPDVPIFSPFLAYFYKGAFRDTLRFLSYNVNSLKLGSHWAIWGSIREINFWYP